MVRVLVLVDRDVAEALVELETEVVPPLEEEDDRRDEVVEVEGVPLAGALPVDREDPSRRLLGAGFRRGEEGRVVEPLLRAADHVRKERRAELLDVDARRDGALTDEGELVVLVEDGEVLPEAHERRVLAEEPHGERVKGRDERTRELAPVARGATRLPATLALRADSREQLFHALAHLARGLVRERDREDRVPRDPRLDEAGDPTRDDACFSRPGTRDDEERAIAVEHGFALLGRESRKEVHEAMVLPGPTDTHHSRHKQLAYTTMHGFC